jgi:hypothetical protein
MDIHPLENFGVNLIGTFNSGRPYTLRRLTGNEPFNGGGTSRAPLTGVNSVYSDWSYRLDLKIDKTFISDIGEDPDDTALCDAIIAMAHSLGLSIIGEGVENKV